MPWLLSWFTYFQMVRRQNKNTFANFTYLLMVQRVFTVIFKDSDQLNFGTSQLVRNDRCYSNV
jgi:hypothetical protein